MRDPWPILVARFRRRATTCENGQFRWVLVDEKGGWVLVFVGEQPAFCENFSMGARFLIFVFFPLAARRRAARAFLSWCSFSFSFLKCMGWLLVLFSFSSTSSQLGPPFFQKKVFSPEVFDCADLVGVSHPK